MKSRPMGMTAQLCPVGEGGRKGEEGGGREGKVEGGGRGRGRGEGEGINVK
jgi:hypothetical protein